MADNSKIRYAVFLILILLVLGVIFALISNLELITQNLVAIIIIAFVLFILWRYDLILQMKDYERAVIYRFGKVSRVGGPGWALIIPVIETFSPVDLRTQTLDVPRQEVITSDKVELSIDAVIYLHVNKDSQSVVNSIVNVEDYRKAAQLFVVSVIRDIAGSMDMPTVITSVEIINTQVKQGLEQVSKEWGINVEAVQIKDIDIPKAVLDALQSQKIASQEKLARMERALGQKAEIDAVKEASAGLSNEALTYYYIKALEKMADGQATKIIFPVEITKLAELVTGKIVKNDGQTIDISSGPYAQMIKDYLEQNKKKKK
ncbi:MAG: SPFH domain-containing protein [archaeon]|nr:SPFH domain-containing protein [archaeon]